MKSTFKLGNVLQAGVWYWIVFTFTDFLLFFIFSLSDPSNGISISYRLLSSVADSLLITFVCTLLRGKWKLISLVVPFLLSLLLFANLLYLRNFEDMIPATSYIRSSITDPIVVEGALSSLHSFDWIYLAIPCFPAVYFFIGNRKEIIAYNLSWKAFVVELLSVIILFGASYAGAYRRTVKWGNGSSLSEVTAEIFKLESVNWKNYYEWYNFSHYATVCVINMLKNNHIELTLEDKKLIAGTIENLSLIRKNGSPACFEPFSPDSTNLILIVVESFPMKALELKLNDSTLLFDKLLSDTGVIVSRCDVLIGHGQSSDAQFMFNTGLLPLINEPVVSNYSQNDYPSIAKALNRESIEIIGEEKGLWSHSVTNKSYGYDRLIDNVARTGLNQDKRIFDRAMLELENIDNLFYLFLTTLSMHIPYDENKVTSTETDVEGSFEDARDTEYLRRLIHFRDSLYGFLQYLRDSGKYDNSIIVIVGDHQIPDNHISPQLRDSAVPFIIINSPYKPEVVRESTQIDVFPTILDMLGLDYKYNGMEYSGLGNSLFTDSSMIVSPHPSETDYKVSELIIKGEF